jgi:hypothetical protein
MKKNISVSDSMTKNIIRLNLSDELTKAKSYLKSIKLDAVLLLKAAK